MQSSLLIHGSLKDSLFHRMCSAILAFKNLMHFYFLLSMLAKIPAKWQ
jgi:hypothetical protein